MRLTLALLLPLACFANYPSQQSVLLDVGATRVILTDSVSGTSQTLIYGPGSGHRLRLTFSPINVPPPSGTSYSSCADPCTITMARNWGIQHQFEELTNNSGTPLNSVGPHHSTLPMIEPAADAAGAWTFPIEVIGQDYFVKRVQVTNPGSVRTNLRLRMRLNHVGCAIAPYDTKASVQVNGGAATANDGNWIAVSNSTITQLDKNNYYGPGTAAQGDWDVTLGPVPQGSIGGTPDTIEVSVPIPDNLVTTSTNTVGFRSYCPDGRTSGYRVLDFNFDDTSTQKAVTQFVVSSNTATGTATSHGWSTNDYIYFYNTPGIRARFGGTRQITSTGASSFTFTTCGTNANVLNCTSPNGTYTVPTSQQPTIAMATQPVMYGIRQLIPQSAYSYEDPTTWTAPSGGNAGTGATLWAATSSLVNPGLPYLANTITASCADCHTVSGLDLKYFNYSNYSIEQRTLFHGLSFQSAKDIAAFIRGVSATVPAIARPWNPLNQPCPTVDSGTVNAWSAGGGIDCELGYGPDALEYMAPSGSYTSWDTTSRMSAHNLPLMWQMPTWNQALVGIHPKDFFPSAGFASSNVYLDYLDFRANVTPASFSSYKSWAGTQLTGYQPIGFLNLSTFANMVEIPNGAGAEVPGFIAPAMYMFGRQSIAQWGTVKMWELEKEFGLESFCSQVYTDIYGAATSAAGYLDRCWYSSIPFNLAYHKSFLGSYHNTDNSTVVSYNYQSNQAYVWQEIINNGNLRETGDFTMDIPYTWAFLNGTGKYRPSGYLNYLNMIMASQSSWDQGLVASGGESFNIYGINPRFPVNISMRFMLAFDATASITNLFNRYMDLFAEVITKGNTAAWQTWGTSGPGAGIADCSTLGPLAAALQGGTLCDGVAFILPIMAYYGVTSAKIDAVQTWAAAVYSTHNFAKDRSAAASGVFSISGNTATWVSGDDFTNFGVDGSGSPAILSNLYIGSTNYNITAVASNHSLTLSGSPPTGTQSYTRCLLVNPGGVAPGFPTCGNI